MAKRRASNVTANGNTAAPKKEQTKKPVRKNRPAPPAEEVEVDEIIEDDFDEDDFLNEEEINEMEVESKPSIWARVKESKPVKFGEKVAKVFAGSLAVYGAVKLAEKFRGSSRSSDEDDYEDEYDDDSSNEE